MWLEVLYSKECVCVMLLPYACMCYCMSEVISSFRSLRAGSQVFALLMLFICVNQNMLKLNDEQTELIVFTSKYKQDLYNDLA